MESLLIVDDQIEVRRQIRSMLQKASLEPKAIFEAAQPLPRWNSSAKSTLHFCCWTSFYRTAQVLMCFGN